VDPDAFRELAICVELGLQSEAIEADAAERS
jgi:hypothetical protein